MNTKIITDAAYELIAEEFETHPDFSEARQTVKAFTANSLVAWDAYEETGLHGTKKSIFDYVGTVSYGNTTKEVNDYLKTQKESWER
jgi:hypothetical protein